MVSTRNTTNRRSTVTQEDSPRNEPEEAIPHIPDLVSVSFLLDHLFLYINCIGTLRLPAT